jgi:hypothetical protein
MKPLAAYIPETNMLKPMEGKKFGERLSWLNSQVQKVKEIFINIKKIIYEIVKK